MTPIVEVSDHAVLRYMQRAMGIDVEAVRRRIGMDCFAAASAGARSLKSDGIKYVIRGGAVVTVMRTDADFDGADVFDE